VSLAKHWQALYLYDMKKILIALVVSGLTLTNLPSSFAVAKAGAKCTKAGATEVSNGMKYTCIKSGTKLIWNNGTKVATSVKESVNQINARKTASNYLSFSAFSRSSLIKQLEFEGFNTSDATYGVDAQKADWKAQAAKAAKNYLSFSSFSRSGLIEQLLFEGYTTEQATFGVDSTGLK
jgi:hypothetical protein